MNKGAQQPKNRNTVLLPKLQKPKLLAPRGRNVYIGSNLSMANTKNTREGEPTQSKKMKKSAMVRNKASIKAVKDKSTRDSFNLSGSFEDPNANVAQIDSSIMDVNFTVTQ